MTPDEFAARARKAADGIQKSATEGVRAGAVLMSESILASVASATHGTLQLRGTAGKRGAPTLKVKARSHEQGVLIQGAPVGIWSMLDSGTVPHLIGAGKGRTLATNIKTRKQVTVRVGKNGKISQSSKRKLIKIGDRVVVTGPFMAGGSPGHHTFKRGVVAGEPRVKATVEKTTVTQVRRSLLGH